MNKRKRREIRSYAEAFPRPHEDDLVRIFRRGGVLGADGSLIIALADGDVLYCLQYPLHQRIGVLDYFHGVSCGDFQGQLAAHFQGYYESPISGRFAIACQGRSFVVRMIVAIQRRFRWKRRRERLRRLGVMLASKALGLSPSQSVSGFQPTELNDIPQALH